VCHFFNAAEDKHCGGCGRRLKAAGPLAAEMPPVPAYAPAGPGELELDDEPLRPAPAAEDAAGQGVSQSEIDGLFENILDDEPAEDGK
jgi:hypothetical protein